jgi:hypothetical protein
LPNTVLGGCAMGASGTALATAVDKFVHVFSRKNIMTIPGMMKLRLLLCVALLCPAPAMAQISAPESMAASQQQVASAEEGTLSHADKMFLARQFVSRIKQGFSKAKQTLKKAGFAAGGDEAEGLPEGEDLLFNIRLAEDRIRLDTPLLGRVYDKKISLSLRDFAIALELPIEYNADTQRFEGWYIRENKLFSVDATNRAVTSDHGTFELSSSARFIDNDLFVPVAELSQWFGFSLVMDVPHLEIVFDSPIKLPIQERLARQKRGPGGQGVGDPVLPVMEEQPEMIGIPMVDVATNSRYYKPGNGADVQNQHRATVRTAGDFMGGTLGTQSQFDREEKLTSLRMNYKQESLQPELLGPLKARKYELGDVTLVNQPLDTFNSLGTGVRVTNIHPLRSYLRPTTEITGEAFPGWEVELYRDSQLVGYQVVGDDGIYRFEQVSLYRSDNTFRVVLYGPQGEQREEEIYVPVDSSRLSEMGSAYDISINRQNDITYRKADSTGEDDGAVSLSAQYEVPLNETTAVSAGVESGSRDGDQIVVGHAGASTIMAETLLNLNTAVENTGEMAAELVARRNLGEHELRNEIKVNTEAFGISADSEGQDIFKEQFSVNGPLGIDFGSRPPRYNMDFDFGLDSNGNNALNSTVGVSGSVGRVALNQQFRHTMSDLEPDDTLHSITNLTGTIGKNRLRLAADYEITPDSNLDFVTASVRRFVDQDLEAELSVDHRPQQKFTEGRAQLNWWAGFAHLSPGISYNSDNDLAVTLNTRFGLAKDPQSGDVRMFDRSITSNGGISAFVFLDNNGDSIFNDGDEPLPEVIVRAPQNSGREITGEDGYAFFNRLVNMRMTDVFVDPQSLKDPFWIPGNQGAAVLPREGHVSSLQFPVHLSGEMDGSVYARRHDGTTRPLRGVSVALYDASGKKAMSAVSEADGFYLLSKIPPGDYFLNVDGDLDDAHYMRPAPTAVKIGYDGTTIYGNNIYIDEGVGDVPYSILSSAAAIAPDPAKLEGKSYVLNLGSYTSRVMMGVTWYKLKSLYGAILAGTDLLEKPSQSFVDTKGKHVLRVVVPGNSMTDAQRRCRSLVARGQACSVEILPGGLPQQVSVETPDSQG